MRIIGGSFKGAVLYGPKGADTRPTSDKVREALFNIIGSQIEGASFLDLFGGTGAVGFEALSRGASQVTIVEADQIDLIRKNAAKLKIETSERFHVIKGDTLKAIQVMEKRNQMFDFIFADPPWSKGHETETVKNAARILNFDGTLILEAFHKTEPPQPASSEQKPGIGLKQTRRWGDTALHFYAF